jgi:hypothetical protein
MDARLRMRGGVFYVWRAASEGDVERSALLRGLVESFELI